MQITVSIRWTVIVNDDIDSLNINAATENIGRDQDALFECFECRVPADPRDIQILREVEETRDSQNTNRSSC